MKVQKKHQYHGAALAQIVEHERFTALNKASKDYGHDELNSETVMLVKYRSSTSGPWKFSFSLEEVDRLDRETSGQVAVFLVLVCGTQTVCLLDADQMRRVLVLVGADEPQSIEVVMPPGKSMRVSGTGGKLKTTVATNRFPDGLFARS